MFAALLMAQSTPTLVLPAHTAYLLQAPEASRTDTGKIVGLKAPKAQLLWGGHLSKPGTLSLSVDFSHDQKAAYAVRVKGPGIDTDCILPPGKTSTVKVSRAGWYTFTLHGEGQGLAAVSNLTLAGTPVEGAQFNLKTRLNCASVHIGYPVEKGTEVEWCYNEVKAVTDPVTTYYMACGFTRGYFGMQVNSERERRIIFSIWDAGNEAIDRKKVDSDNRVRLLAKGPGVVAEDFGNEGTGGHSHLVTDWKTADRQRFLVHAKPDGKFTTYTGYYFSPKQRAWTLVASFRAPKDGNWLNRLYSFNENFWGDNGNLLRAAEFGPAWIRTSAGEWKQLTTGRFTHDVTGGKDRFDYDLTVRNGRWLLQNGGFVGSSPKLGTLVENKVAANAPQIDLERLPR